MTRVGKHFLGHPGPFMPRRRAIVHEFHEGATFKGAFLQAYGLKVERFAAAQQFLSKL